VDHDLVAAGLGVIEEIYLVGVHDRAVGMDVDDCSTSGRIADSLEWDPSRMVDGVRGGTRRKSSRDDDRGHDNDEAHNLSPFLAGLGQCSTLGARARRSEVGQLHSPSS
jgi:hypothetical protein